MSETRIKGQVAREIADDGIAVVRALIDDATCTRLIGVVEHLRANPSPMFRTLSPAGQPVVQSDLFRWRDTPELAALVKTGPLPRLAGEVFGTNEVILLEDQFFYSATGSSTPSPWHQDHPYHPLEPWFLTIWIPLDPVPESTGLRAVRGSHLGPTFAPVEFSAREATLASGTAVLRDVPAIDDDPIAFSVVAPDFNPGDAMLLDSRTLHAAGGPCATTFRRLSIRYAAPDSRYHARAWPVATFWQEHDVEAHLGEPIASPAFPLVAA